MNSDNDMNDLIKKAQEMIKNNQVPDEVKQFVSNMSTNGVDGQNVNSLANQSSNVTPNINSTSKPNNAPSIDMKQIMNMASKFNSQNSDDDMSRLLFALKPYLRNQKKEKIDEYLNLIKMGKMAQFFDLMGNNKKQN